MAKTGYLQAIDIEALIRIATRHDIVLLLEQRPGDFVVQGSPLARYASETHDHEKLNKHVNEACLISIQRTTTQDVEFAINQLVEVAIRALSPGINDPFTAMTCIDWLGRACCQMFERILPSPYHYDKAQTLRVMRPAETLERLIDIAFNQIREASSTNTAVTIQLLETLGSMLVFLQLSTPASHEVRVILLRHAACIVHGSQKGISNEDDQYMIRQRYQEEIIM